VSLSDVMSAAGLTTWTELALVISLITFAAIVIRVFVLRSRRDYEHASGLPLDDGAEPAPGGRERT
jgi:cbb3-type cytochrome oxidase subunit 3